MKLKRMKQIAALLSVSLLMGLAVACSSDNKPNAGSASSTTESPEPSAAQASAGPKYPASFSYWLIMDTDAAVSIKNYSEMGIYKELEKITGTKVEFQHPPAGEEQVKDQFNLMMATGKLPDVMAYTWKANSPDKMIKDGKILRLNDIIDKYAPNLSKLLNDKPDLKRQLTSDDGNIYVFPFVGEDNPVFTFHGLFMRKDWLDKLNLTPPATLDEWEKVLTAFRDGDPNGNGKKDEIPYFYRQTDYETSYPFLGAYGLNAAFYQEDGVVKYGPYQPQFKDYLTLMNKWYSQGLIDKDYLTTDVKIRDSKMLSDQIGSMAGWGGSGMGGYLQLKRQQDPNSSFKLIGLPFPSLKTGELAVSSGAPTAQWSGIGVAITTSAKNPEEIASWLDYGYSPEGKRLYNFGVEGESYEMENGKPKYTETITNNPNKLSITQALGLYTVVASSGPFQADEDADLQWHPDPDTQDAMRTWTKADHSKFMPSNLNSDEQTQIASIMTDLRTYQYEMIDKFIMGREPLSKFDEYIATLKKLGIEEATKIYQAQYDRYMKKS